MIAATAGAAQGAPGDLSATMVADIHSADSFPSNLTDVNGTLFFVARDNFAGYELWKSDGTGAVGVKDIYEGPGNSLPSDLTNVNGTLFFSAADATHGRELWRSDGTEAGTTMVEDIYPGFDGPFPNGGVFLSDFINVNGTLFFIGTNATNGSELWKSDGTPAGTSIVADIDPGSGSGVSFSSEDRFAEVNGTVYFAGSDGENGVELWKSNGTDETEMVRDANPDAGHTFPSELTEANGGLFFVGFDPDNGQELWRSNGSELGTAIVENIAPDAANSSPYALTDVNGTLFFGASPGADEELWKSNGTELGTMLVKDVVPEGFLTDFNGTLLFQGDDGVHGDEMWKSNGSTAGTTMVKDIYPGVGDSYAGWFTDVNGTLFLGARDPTNGGELRKSDLTAAGTTIVKDINPINSSDSFSNLLYFTSVDDTLFFVADDGSHGQELWKTGIEQAEPQEPPIPPEVLPGGEGATEPTGKQAAALAKCKKKKGRAKKKCKKKAKQLPL